MARISPLRQRHVEAEAALLGYGPPETPVELVETFGEIELEYAAIRKSCALLDQPNRAVIEVTGADGLDLLNRMLTQNVGDMPEWSARASFWLNRKGRIDADPVVVRLPDRVLMDVDVHAAARTVESLDSYIFSEDAELSDATERTHRLSLHGPAAAMLLSRVGEHVEGSPPQDMGPGRAGLVRIGGQRVLIWREDSAGVPGFELMIPSEGAVAVYTQLVEAGQPHNGDDERSAPSVRSQDQIRLRPIGWHAFNIARVEAGTPLYNLDYGPDTLPHETGLVSERVSFSKGCFLGQEIVARMESRGKAKRVLVSLRAEGDIPTDEEGMPRQPVTGSHVLGDSESDVVGAVTSSVLSPMLGRTPICLAMVKSDLAEPGRALIVEAEGERLSMSVQATRSFL